CKEIEKIMGGDDELKFANKCSIKCPKCPNEEAMFLELQTRSADEPMTIFYQCTLCRFDWKE
ncbi:DNA-directed RNA polymerase III subunit RPC11, partial [Enteropsectra breve]